MYATSSSQRSSTCLSEKLQCHCDSRHVERISQLQNRIKQHVPKWLRQQLIRPCRSQPHRSSKRNDTKPDCAFAIGQHLLKNEQCALNYDNKRFSILATTCSSFHLNLVEAVYNKTQLPMLRRQKKFVYTLKTISITNAVLIWPRAALALTRITMLAQPLACLDCLQSKLMR